MKEKWNRMKAHHDTTSIHVSDNIDDDRRNFVQSTQQFEIQKGNPAWWRPLVPPSAPNDVAHSQLGP